MISYRPRLLALAAAVLAPAAFLAPAAVPAALHAADKPPAKTDTKTDTAPATKPGDAAKGQRLHALAMHGEPKYGPDFKHFDFVNPNAPKGGLFIIGEIGTFNTLNPFSARANSDIWTRLLIHGHLMQRSNDEPFSMYPWIAKSVTMPPSRRWVEFHLDPRAKFSDGTPVTPEDVIFSWKIITTKGSPFWRSYFADVKEAVKTGPRSVRFNFKGQEDNRELPLIVAGDLPILSKAYWSKLNFDENTMAPPVVSGPYYIAKVTPGRSITYKLVPDYWARDIPALKGTYNFGTWRAVYFRDASIATEALKGGQFDYRAENSATQWARSYAIDEVKQGLLIKRKINHKRPQGMQMFAFNIRRDIFKDPRVRRALVFAFDYNQVNKNMFYGQYTRTDSYFDNSELASRGLPKGEELELLKRFKGQIPDSVFTEPYTLPTYKDGRTRKGLRQAFKMLRDAGWVVKGRKLVNAKTGKPFEFELLLVSPAFERIALPFKRSLARLGIDMRIRLVSQSEYVNRLLSFEFDMAVLNYGQSSSPGNEQRSMWSSEAAKTKSSRNFTGISNKAVDALIELIISAPDRKSLVTRVRALDRVLLHHHLGVPQWHATYDRLVYWDKFGIPEPTKLMGTSLIYWWIDPKKAAALKAKKAIRSLSGE